MIRRACRSAALLNRVAAALLALGAGLAQATTTLRCATPLALEVELPATLLLDEQAEGAMLLVEERGADLLLQREDAVARVQWDLAPSGWAYQVAAVEGPARWSLLPAVAGTSRTHLRLSLFCAGTLEAAESAALHLLDRAGRAFARAEDAKLPAAERSTARQAAVDALSGVAAAAAAAPLRPRWAWLAPQALQARAYAYARLGRPADSRNDLLAAAAQWGAGHDAQRRAIAEHRAAQQWRREGDLAAAEKLLRRLRGDPVVQADLGLAGIVTNDYCLTLRHLLRLEEALDCYGRAIALHERAGDSAEAALSRANRADAYAQLGRHAQAEAEVQAARLQAQHSGRLRPQLLAALVAGNLARAQGQLDAAIRAYLEALAFSESLQDPNLRANALQQIGIAYLLLGDLSRARQFLGDAAAAYVAGSYWNNAVVALRNLADAERRAGHAAAAAAAIARALDLIASGRVSQAAAAEVHLLRAELALEEGGAAPLDEALAAAQSALGDAPSYLHRQRLSLALARRALRQGANGAAAQWLAEATRAANRAGDALGLVELEQWRAELAQQRGDAAAARRHLLQGLQQALRVAGLQTYPLHRASYLRQARRSLEQLLLRDRAEATAAPALAQRLGWVAQWHEAARSGEPQAAPDGERDAATLALVNEQVRRRWGIQSSEELERAPPPLPLGLFARAQQLGAAATPTRRGAVPLRLTDWNGYLRPDESLVVSFVGEQAVFVWTLQGGRLSEHFAAAAPLLRRQAAALQTDLQDLTKPAPAVRALAAPLRQTLGLEAPGPVASAHYYLLADEALAALPPALLLQATSALSTALPAATRLDSLDLPAAPRGGCCRGRKLQAFADPALAPGNAGARSASGLPRLPGGRAEARAIAAHWTDPPAQLWLGDAFTRRRVLQALAEPEGLVHFATHGFMNRDEPGLSALLVAADAAQEGLDVVSFHDLLRNRVAARLVVLGACDAGAGLPAGDASLAHALLAAGAAEVLAPLWAVDDQAGTAFMRAFYAALAAGRSTAQALAEAQALLAARAETAHPFYWSGFVLQAATRRN